MPLLTIPIRTTEGDSHTTINLDDVVTCEPTKDTYLWLVMHGPVSGYLITQETWNAICRNNASIARQRRQAKSNGSHVTFMPPVPKLDKR